MPGLRLNLGLSLFKGGELREAIQIFRPLQKAESSNSAESLRLKTLIGLAHYGLGDYAAAVPYLKEATASDVQNLSFRLALAHSCLWSRQYQCVLDVYHEIVTLNAESAEADMLAGEAYDEMKNDAGAIEQFRAAVKADPKMPNAHFGYGYLLWRQLKFEEAEHEFKAELLNTPEHASALAYLGDTEIHLGRPEDAPPFLLQAIRIEPTIALAHLDLGIVYSDQGRKRRRPARVAGGCEAQPKRSKCALEARPVLPNDWEEDRSQGRVRQDPKLTESRRPISFQQASRGTGQRSAVGPEC